MNNKTYDKDYEIEITNKTKSVDNFISYGIDKLQSMFSYDGLPDTIPQRNLEKLLLTNGNCVFISVNGKYYVATGGYGGYKNPYYESVSYIVSNPWINGLKDSKEFFIEDFENHAQDSVLIRNDSEEKGLLPLLTKYGVLLCENELSIRTGVINTRLTSILSAGDDKTRTSAMNYLQDVKNGKLGVVAEQTFFDGLRVQNSQINTNYLTQHIELEQYLKASFYNEIGLNSNYNMKREYIGKEENLLTDDVLLPFCYNMFICRKIAIEKINKLFGLDISITFDSSWLTNETENGKEIENNGGVNNVTSQLEEDAQNGNSETDISNVDQNITNNNNGGDNPTTDNVSDNNVDNNDNKD